MAQPQLRPRHTPGAQVVAIDSGFRFSIPSGKANEYRFAQLDDYTLLPRGRFPHRFPLSLSLSARASSDSIAGTWGFGLWNDPFGLSLGFGGNPFRLPALPNAVWFFSASKENYLSFKSIRPERMLSERSETKQKMKGESQPKSFSQTTTFTKDLASTAPPTNGGSAQLDALVANGFFAQSFRSPKVDLRLIPAGLALPFSRKTTRRLLGKIIAEDGVALKVDSTQWHRYKLEWGETRVNFEVDDALVFESPVSPHPPLGIVIWIDNQYASFTPEGKIGFGVLENPEPAWLEIMDLDIR